MLLPSDELVKARQADLLREAAEFRVVAQLPPSDRDPFALVRRVLARCRAIIANLSETRPIRRRASVWLSQQ